MRRSVSSNSIIVRNERKINKTRLYDLFMNVFVLYFLYFLTGLIYEGVITKKYLNFITKKKEKSQHPDAINLVIFVVAWIFGQLYMKKNKIKKMKISDKSAAVCGFLYAFGQCCSILAIRRIGYPLVTMAQSSSAGLVVVFALFFTRVKDHSLALNKRSFPTAISVTVGILLFYYAIPNLDNAKHPYWISGLFFIFLVLICESILPDFQASMKQQFNPDPAQMMTVINKWSSFFMFVYLVLTFKFWDFIYYIIAHPVFTAQLLVNCVLAAVGQLFVYKIIKKFKQHILPFIRASRKVLTVVISIAVYNHQTNWLQIIAIIIVLGSMSVQFFLEVSYQRVEFADGNISQISNEQLEQLYKDMDLNIRLQKDFQKNQ